MTVIAAKYRVGRVFRQIRRCLVANDGQAGAAHSCSPIATRATKSIDAGNQCSTTGSLAWLIERYRETTAWSDLSLATRRNRENHFRRVIEKAGHQPIRNITSAAITKGRDSRSATPAQARNFLDAMRGLFKWAKEAKHVTVDPTDGVKNPKRKKGPGFPVWTEDDAAAYDKRWPVGTKERVWRDVLFYTGLRRGDAVTLGRQYVRDGVATLRTEKSQGDMIVSIPILPILQQTLEAGLTGELAFIWKTSATIAAENGGLDVREPCECLHAGRQPPSHSRAFPSDATLMLASSSVNRGRAVAKFRSAQSPRQ